MGQLVICTVSVCVQVFAWGLNTSGQLGLNDAVVRKSPAVVDALWAMPVQQLAAGKRVTTQHYQLFLAYLAVQTFT